jgi:rhodanese-related sulfurtransferase
MGFTSVYALEGGLDAWRQSFGVEPTASASA